MDECAVLEKQCGCKITVSSNLTPSAFARRSFSEVGIRLKLYFSMDYDTSMDYDENVWVGLRRTQSAFTMSIF